MAPKSKQRRSWWVSRNGEVVDTILAEDMYLKDGLVVFSTGGDIIAVTALGGGTVLRCEEPVQLDYVDPKVLAV